MLCSPPSGGGAGWLLRCLDECSNCVGIKPVGQWHGYTWPAASRFVPRLPRFLLLARLPLDRRPLCHCPPWIHDSRRNPFMLHAAGRCAPQDLVSEIGHFAATIQASPEICRRQHGAKRVRTLVYARRLPHARSRGFSPSPTCCLEAGCSQRRRLHCRAILR